MTGRALTLLAAFTVTTTAPVHAQGDAFSWLRIGAGASWLKPRFPPGDFWATGVGGALRAEVPLTPGILSAGVHLHRATAGTDVIDPAVDRLTWMHLFVGWGREIDVGPVELGAELRVGTLMTAAPDSVSNPVERELTMGLGGWLGKDLGAGWSLRSEAAVGRVHSYVPWKFASLTLGLARSLGVPERIGGAVRRPEGATRSTAVERDRVPWWASFPELPARALDDEGVSTDRVDRFWSPGLLRSPEAGSPRFWLDGIPIPNTTLGGPAWPRVPLGSADLGGLRGETAPDLVHGRLELEGVVRATSRRPANRAWGRAMILNESGDPGPLRFTELASPNIDGPLYEFDAGAGHRWSDGWVSASAVVRERWSVTRPEMRGRNPAFFRGSSSRVRVDGGSVGTRQRLGAVTVRARAWASGGDRFLRAPGLGNELSSDVEYRGAGISASIPVTSIDSLRVYTSAAAWTLTSPNDDRPAVDVRSIDWTERDHSAGLEYRATRGAFRTTIGVDVRHERDGLQGDLWRRTAATAFAVLARRGSAWNVSAGLERGLGAVSKGGLVRVERALGSVAWLSGTASWREGIEHDPFAVWDYAVDHPSSASRLGTTLVGLAARRAGRRATARLELRADRPGWTARLGAFWHDFAGELRPAVNYQWRSDVVIGSLGPLEPGAGSLFGAAADVASATSARVAGRLTAVAVRATSSSGAFEDWWSGAPRVRIRAEGSLRVRPGWWVRAALRVRREVWWSGFELVTARGAVPGGGRVGGAALGDLRLEGSVLGGRLRVLVGVDNLFDADTRLHPLGANEARGLVLGVGTAL